MEESYVKQLIFDELNKNVRGVKTLKKTKSKEVYRVELDDGVFLRLDTKGRHCRLETVRLQQLAYDNNIEVSNVLAFEGGKFKVSEWIEGVRLLKVWHKPEVLIQSGDLMVRLNLVKDPQTGLFLCNSDFSGDNLIWTKDNRVYIIDNDGLGKTKNIDGSVVKALLRRIINRSQIDLFLEGYSKYRDINGILKELEKRKYRPMKRKKKRK